MYSFWRNVLILLLVPFVVTVAGGLLVEILKPREPVPTPRQENQVAGVESVKPREPVPTPRQENQVAGVKNEVSENKDTKVESPMMATNMAAVEAANDKKLSDAKAHAAAFEEAQRVRAANDKKLSDATEKILTNPSLSNIWTALDVSALSWKEARTLTGVPADGTWQPGKTWQELGTAMPNAFHYFSQTLDEKAAAAKVDLSGLHPVVRVDAYLQLSRLALLRKMNWTGSADDTPDTSKWSDPPADLKRHYDDRIEEYRNIASGK